MLVTWSPCGECLLFFLFFGSPDLLVVFPVILPVQPVLQLACFPWRRWRCCSSLQPLECRSYFAINVLTSRQQLLLQKVADAKLGWKAAVLEKVVGCMFSGSAVKGRVVWWCLPGAWPLGACVKVCHRVLPLQGVLSSCFCPPMGGSLSHCGLHMLRHVLPVIPSEVIVIALKNETHKHCAPYEHSVLLTAWVSLSCTPQNQFIPLLKLNNCRQRVALLEEILLNVWCCFDQSQITSQSVNPGVIYSCTNGIFVLSTYAWSACAQLVYLAQGFFLLSCRRLEVQKWIRNEILVSGKLILASQQMADPQHGGVFVWIITPGVKSSCRKQSCSWAEHLYLLSGGLCSDEPQARVIFQCSRRPKMLGEHTFSLGKTPTEYQEEKNKKVE